MSVIASDVVALFPPTTRVLPWTFPKTLRARLPGIVALALAASFSVGFWTSASHYTIVDGGLRMHVTTHVSQVRDVLAEANVAVHEGDLVSPPLNAMLADHATVSITRGLPFVILADNQTIPLNAQPAPVSALLAAAHVLLGPADVAQPAATAVLTAGQTITVTRAVPIDLTLDGLPMVLQTVAATVGQALQQASIQLYPEDLVAPALSTPVSAGIGVTIRRATLVTVVADGKAHTLRTQAATVAAVLDQLGIVLHAQDIVSPAVTVSLTPNLIVRVTRVGAGLITSTVPIPFNVQQISDNTMDIGAQSITPGVVGVEEIMTSTVTHDGHIVSETSLGSKILSQPQDEVIRTGTMVVVLAAATPTGPIHYSATLTVFATWYDAASAGGNYTATGAPAVYGVIAVDPSVIPLGTHLYVPGYGYGLAADTGGSIIGDHIDLCYDNGQDHGWATQWVTIYILAG